MITETFGADRLAVEPFRWPSVTGLSRASNWKVDDEKTLFYACLLAPVSGLAQDQGVTPSTEAPASEAEAAPAAAEAPAETEATTLSQHRLRSRATM